MATTGEDGVASDTVTLLETRLQDLEFYTKGTDALQEQVENPPIQGREGTVQQRLKRIDDGLQRLAAESQVVQDILALYNSHPDIFPPSSAEEDQATFSTTEQLAVVDSCATLFSTTASRLTSVQDTPIAPAESSASLIALHPRLAKVELVQQSQSEEMAELRLRTATILQRWYETGVIGQGECWTEWEGRLMEAEKVARREESARTRESNTV